MMWCFFDPDTGTLHESRVRTIDPSIVESIRPEGFVAIQGDFDPATQRIDLQTMHAVDEIPAPPVSDGLIEWSWDAVRRSYVSTPTIEGYWAAVRAERNRRLAASDWIVARSAEAGESVPDVWQTYRQALRDITTQPEPLSIVWPTPPAT